MADVHGVSSGRSDSPASDAEYPAYLIVMLDRDGVALHGPRAGMRQVLDFHGLHWLAAALGAEPNNDSISVPESDLIEWFAREARGQTAAVHSTRASHTTTPGAHDPARPLNRYEGDHVLVSPTAIMLSGNGFEFVDHDGVARAVLDSRGLSAATSLTTPCEIEAAFAEQSTRLGHHALDRGEFERLVGLLCSSGLLVPVDQDSRHLSEGRVVREFRRGMALARRRADSVRVVLDAQEAEETLRVAETGRVRTKVVPVNSEGNPLLSLGVLMAHAMAHDGGRLLESYQFLPDWGDQTVPTLTGDEAPALYLFSNYIWSHAWNVVRSAEVKKKSPGSLTIHGGPNTPKYEKDTEAFFHFNPQVDISVHGEGEGTFVELLSALDGRLGDGPPDLSILRDICGITYRDRGEVIHTGARDRIADLDTIPSPYLTRLFDSTGDTEITLMTLETNRGCPYGCTFCDWGSATNSRIRKFDLERIFAELEWCASHRVHTVFCADSNFGIFARDVEIAQKVVELHQQHGYPKIWESSYAKNSVKHLREIIETLASGGVLATGTLSLQSADAATLDAIHRSNIRVDKYDDLATEFSKNDLPLVVELMMGLPGATMESFLGDLQQCIDREVKTRVNPTEVLMNSPMNDPEYVSEHEIRTLRPVTEDWSEANHTRKKALVVSSATFTRAEYNRMERYRLAYLLSENFAVLRHVSRFVRQETGIKEMDLYVRLVDDTSAEPSAWPMIHFTFSTLLEFMVPPVSWQLFIGELRDYLVTRLGMTDGGALRTVLEVQHALLPSRGRTFPYTIELEHDYTSWHQAMLEVKRIAYLQDWTADTPRLESFGAASFEVDDPQDLCSSALGMALVYDTDADWELGSPIARPMRFRAALAS